MLASGVPTNPNLTTTAQEERTERSELAGRSQRIPGAVATPSGKIERRVSLMSGDRAVRLTTSSPRRNYMGIWLIPTMPTPRVKGCTEHSERPRLCGPRANYGDDYSSPRLGCWIKLCEEYPAVSGHPPTARMHRA